MSAILWLFINLTVLTGCWNQNELPEFAFVQAIGIDLLEDGKIMLTTLFYKPGSGDIEGESSKTSAGFVVRTNGATLFEAVRDIMIHMGRKAQWSHMRMILISEKAARNGQMQGVMDYFLRDHEPRETVNLAIAVGRAGEYLQQKPVIESTIGQQLYEMNNSSHKFTGKTLEVNILNASIQFKSESGVAMLPIVFANGNPLEGMSVAGLALFKKGKFVGKLEPQMTEYLLMMRNQYDQGIVEVACEGGGSKKNALEKVTAKTHIDVKPAGDTVKISIHTQLLGSYGELRCLDIRTTEEEFAESRRISALLLEKFRETIDYMQKNRVDLLGIGDRLYRTQPGLWMNWRKDWDRRFEQATFDVKVELKIVNSGMRIPKSY